MGGDRMKPFWENTHNGHPQCVYTLDSGERFVVRQYGAYDWWAINLSVRKFGTGQIICHGQSDTDCYRKAIETIEGAKVR